MPIKMGSILREEERILDARSSVTLIEEDEHLIIVDTGLLGEEGVLIDALSARGKSPDDVDLAVNTHLHIDHCGCNMLFRRATFYADNGENPPNHFRPTPDGAELIPGVRFMATPGHTKGSISVVAESNDRTYVIAGDAIPTKENYENMVPPAQNIDPELALKSMERIIAIADFIIPGHGAMFEIHR